MRILILAFCTLFAALPVAAQTAQPFANPREAIDRMIAAVAARDANAVAALYADEAIVLGPNQGVTAGRTAIRDSWLRSFTGGYSALNVLQQRAEAGTDRGAVLMVWEATIERQGQAPQVVRGRSLLYVTRQAEGWLISADMWQPAP
ncbi:MAG: DUF4440 domain-containing protein [Rhodobacteraceae bacterium]|nr:DUF4440 domain-containing protein [Paracoccaceae bacterium]